MLLISVLPTLRWPIFKTTFPAYAPHMLLTAPQRTLMFQTLIFTLYLALGAGIFSSIEGWTYLDGIYWTNYSLLTIGFGSDFTPSSPASRIVLVPYTAAGIFILGLVVTSIRALFVARFRERVVWGKEIVQIQRKQWWRAQMGYVPRPSPLLFWRARNPRKFGNSKIPTLQAPTKWSREEWEVMRYVKKRADDRRRYLSLLTTFSVFVVIWFGGALLFWFTERVSGASRTSCFCV
jgi:potassium channel subfamily K, other eukaryote